MQFMIMLEFEKNRKNSRLIEILDSKIGKKFTLRRSEDKALITEELFDKLQAEIEKSDIDYIALLVKNDEGKTSFLVKDAEMGDAEYDEILRKLRYDRTI